MTSDLESVRRLPTRICRSLENGAFCNTTSLADYRRHDLSPHSVQLSTLLTKSIGWSPSAKSFPIGHGTDCRN